MILPFSTQLNGKPTYFPEKIIAGLNNYSLIDAETAHKLMLDCILKKSGISYPINFNRVLTHTPKKHTIRTDKNNRWRADMPIHFYINNRQPDMFQFAPVVRCASVQDIQINWFSDIRSTDPSKISPLRFNYVDVIVDGKLKNIAQVKILSLNDGFETIEDFFAYFNTDFTGKIIHWTDLKY
ncbi:hypothetical protein GCM10007424_23560 [Flavobacterium suaedae]|uniref:Uncharacterized protein n=1 Tax=Flavobacterium suaedae TaxID=1767027 RepID=A0ABQ1K231_9FLAO|nr:hypothetical protein [Flavobacterium suaedae]GGB82817.1 hypothetical protein GCM10007424_23560 [Flavobacterium suaedae]